MVLIGITFCVHRQATVLAFVTALLLVLLLVWCGNLLLAFLERVSLFNPLFHLSAKREPDCLTSRSSSQCLPGPPVRQSASKCNSARLLRQLRAHYFGESKSRYLGVFPRPSFRCLDRIFPPLRAFLAVFLPTASLVIFHVTNVLPLPCLYATSPAIRRYCGHSKSTAYGIPARQRPFVAISGEGRKCIWHSWPGIRRRCNRDCPDSSRCPACDCA